MMNDDAHRAGGLTARLSGVPRMTMERVDLMRRFITFIDVMYEHKVKLLAAAPAGLSQHFAVSIDRMVKAIMDN